MKPTAEELWDKHSEMTDTDIMDAEIWLGQNLMTRSMFMKAMKEFASQSFPSEEETRLLQRASMLIGNPGTNISASTDIACDNWHKDYDNWLKSYRKEDESKVFEINFNGNVKTQIEVKNGDIAVIQSMNGWGDSISSNDVTITKV